MANGKVSEYPWPQQRGLTNLSQDQWPQDAKDSDRGQDASSIIRVNGVTKKWSGWPGDHVFRLVISGTKVGRLIGRRGESIQKICCKTKARIKILEGIPGTSERIVMVSAKESPDMVVSPAMDAVLRVHRHLIGDLDLALASGQTSQEVGKSITTHLLVAPEHAGCLIGRQGATVKEIQRDSGAVVRVLPVGAIPLCALSNDRMVEINGTAHNVHQALKLVVSHLRKFLVDRSVLVLFEANRASAGLKAYSPCGNAQNQIGQGPNFGQIGIRPQVVTDITSNGRSRTGFRNVNDSFNIFGRHPKLRNHMAAMKLDYQGAHYRHLGVPLYGRDLDPATKYSSENPPPPGITHYHDQMTHHVQAPFSHDASITNPIITNVRYPKEPNQNTLTTQVPTVHVPNMKKSAPEILTAQQIDQSRRATAAPPIPTAQQIDQCFLPGPAGQGAPPSISGSVDTSFPAYASQNFLLSSAANNTGHSWH